mgnify:CR=1 FL=1
MSTSETQPDNAVQALMEAKVVAVVGLDDRQERVAMAKLKDIEGASNVQFTDKDAPKGSVYLVTAWYLDANNDAHGYLKDVNTEYVPGYTGAPTGAPAPATTNKSPIPGFEVGVLVAALAAAVVVVRRRVA